MPAPVIPRRRRLAALVCSGGRRKMDEATAAIARTAENFDNVNLPLDHRETYLSTALLT